MSTAAEIALRVREQEPALRYYAHWYGEVIAKSIMRPFMCRELWRIHLQRVAEATRYQLTYTPTTKGT